jgi:hypothetical protein
MTSSAGWVATIRPRRLPSGAGRHVPDRGRLPCPEIDLAPVLGSTSGKERAMDVRTDPVANVVQMMGRHGSGSRLAVNPEETRRFQLGATPAVAVHPLIEPIQSDPDDRRGA